MKLKLIRDYCESIKAKHIYAIDPDAGDQVLQEATLVCTEKPDNLDENWACVTTEASSTRWWTNMLIVEVDE